MTECAHIERTHALADGELDGPDAVRAREHLATCEICQAELADVMQLAALPAPHIVEKRGEVVSLAWYRKRNLQIATVAVAAAAGVALWIATGRHAGEVPPPHGVEIALAPRRQLEARVSWGKAAEYREYDVPRAGEPPHEAIPLAALAEVEQSGDLHGVAVLALLDGERKQAASYLDKAGDAPDVLADRAALELADGHPERALATCDAVLARRPDHAVALWNRGLALRELGLTRGAAAAFRAVAARKERGWADEAQRRAGALDAEADALEQRYQRITAASVALARGELALTPDDARAEPGYARGILYDAIRAAPSPDRLDALAPLADAIDAADHDSAMKDALARARAGRHPELAKRYGELLRSLAVEQHYAQPAGDEQPVPRGPARAELIAQLRAAHADDLLIGVLYKLSDRLGTVNDAEIGELAKLTARSPDPWMQLLGLQQRAQVALAADDLIGAEAVLLEAREKCARGGPAFRCISISKTIANLYLKWQRLPDARAALADAWSASRRTGEWFLQIELLQLLAKLALFGDDAQASGLPLIRAYTDEIVLRFPPGADDWRCQSAAWGRTLRALDLFDELQFAAARRELAGPACKSIDDPAQAAYDLFVRSEIAREDGSPDEIAKLRAEIAVLRENPGLAKADRILLDHSEGRVAIDRDQASGEALLRRSIAAAKELPPSVIDAHKAAAESYSVLAIAAAKHGDGDQVLAVLAEEQGLVAPNTCAVGIAIEDERRAFVARNAAGKAVVHYDEARKTLALDPATLVPADIVAALAGCASVDVIARPPVHGMARLLGDAIAWRYLSRRGGPPGPVSDRKVVVANVEPPAALELPRLQTWQSDGELLSGPEATPSRVLGAIGGAGEVVIHAHGLVDVAQPDASYLALSPDPDGRFALTTGDVRRARFTASPLIILAACRASQAAPVFHETWSLPAAFVYAGARAVIASAAPIPDGDAGAFFDAVRTRVHAGAAVAVAVRDARQQWITQHRGDWVRDVIVFE